MSLQLRVISSKFRNDFRNGTDFSLNTGDYTSNLTGIVLDLCQVEQVLEVSWDSESSSINNWVVTERSAGKYEVRRESGSFVDDGWTVGNKFDWFDSTTLVTTGTITFISADGVYMFFDSIIAAVGFVGTKDDSSIKANASYTENYLNSIVYTPNLIENSSTYSAESLLNGKVSSWASDNARSLTPVVMNPVGLNRSTYGELTINYEGDVATYFQSFKIVHTFYIVPFYIESQDLFFFDGTNSLKYVFKADFRHVASNPNSAKVITFDTLLGSVGGFNETLVSGQSSYTIDSFNYLTSSSLAIQQDTDIEIKVAGTFDGNTKYTLYFSLLPPEESYSTDAAFLDTFLLSSESGTVGSSATFSGVIKAMSSSTSLGILTINATIGFNTAVSGNYLLALRIGDSSIASGNSNRVVLKVDEDEFVSVTNNNDLIIFNDITFKDYHQFEGSSLKLYNEDGFVVSFNFDLDLNKQAVIKSLSCDVVAYNGSQFFSLNNYLFDLNPTVVGGIQKISIDSNRGYFMESSSEYNAVELNDTTQAAGLQRYAGKLGCKINWLEWVKNNSVDSVFFDASKLNNNLNYKASNYSNENGYTIRVLFRATVEGLDTFGAITSQNYLFFSDEINVLDYLEDTTEVPRIVPYIETFSADGSVSLGGNLLADEDTLFRIKWVLTPPVASVLGSTCVMRIEESLQQGANIHELTNNLPEIDTVGNLLKPKTGFSAVDIYVDGDVYTECLVDSSKLKRGVKYNLSGKLTKI